MSSTFDNLTARGSIHPSSKIEGLTINNLLVITNSLFRKTNFEAKERACHFYSKHVEQHNPNGTWWKEDCEQHQKHQIRHIDISLGFHRRQWQSWASCHPLPSRKGP